MSMIEREVGRSQTAGRMTPLDTLDRCPACSEWAAMAVGVAQRAGAALYKGGGWGGPARRDEDLRGGECLRVGGDGRARAGRSGGMVRVGRYEDTRREPTNQRRDGEPGGADYDVCIQNGGGSVPPASILLFSCLSLP